MTNGMERVDRGLEGLRTLRWHRPEHATSLAQRLAAAPAPRAGLRGHPWLLAAAIVLLAGGTAVAGGAAGVPGLRAMFERGEDGRPELVTRDERGREVRRSRLKPGEIVLSLPEPCVDEPLDDDAK